MSSKHENQKAVMVLGMTYASGRFYSVYAKAVDAEKIKDDWTLPLDNKIYDCEIEISKGLKPFYGDDFRYVGAKEFDLDDVRGREILIESLNHVKRNGYGLFEFSNRGLKEWSYDAIEPLKFILED